MARFRWKHALTALLVAWFLLGSLAYAFYPVVLTGNRLLDAILLAAAVTAVAAPLVEVVAWLLSLPFQASQKREKRDEPV